MPETPDTSAGIDPVIGVQYRHVVAGMHIGVMARNVPAHLNAVLTVATFPGSVPDNILHRHIPLSPQNMNRTQLDTAVHWVRDQLTAQRTVLVRSEGGRQRPGLVVAMVILELGGRYYDATGCLRRADPNALTDFRYLAILADEDARANAKLTY